MHPRRLRGGGAFRETCRMTRFGLLADALDCLSKDVRYVPDDMPDDSCASPPTDTAMMVDESRTPSAAVVCGLKILSSSTCRKILRVCVRAEHTVLHSTESNSQLPPNI